MSTPFPDADPGEGEYFDANEQREPDTAPRTAPTDTIDPAAHPPARRLTAPTNSNAANLHSSRSARNRSSSIRIRRLPSSQRLSTATSTIPEIQVSDAPPQSAGAVEGSERTKDEPTGRKRSFSAPEGRDGLMTAIAAEGDAGGRPQSGLGPIPEGEKAAGDTGPARGPSARRPFLNRFRSGGGAGGTEGRDFADQDDEGHEHEYDDEVANILDVVDPEVSTLATLTNVQNSLFVPDLSIGRFSLVNRRPTYNLSSIRRRDPTTDELVTEAEEVARTESRQGEKPTEGLAAVDDALAQRPQRGRARMGSITSQLSESRYAVLPHGELLEGWSKEDRDLLNDHVRHMLHSRRSKFKRGMKGFGKYVSRPLGFLVTFYAVSITIFGLVWVLFLIGWISGGNDARHKYLINVIDNVLVALFAVVGDGLAPFRAVDTYHMCFIAHYATLTWRKRRETELPKLENRNDLPTAMADLDPESGEKPDEYSVLSPKQQKRLEHHQKKFARSHTYYKPHETTTHYAFSIRLLITITVLLDCHSLLQISLGAVTWGWDWHHRPAVVTTVILCCSISVNILAGILISVGDKRSRKTEVVEQMFRQTLTQEAMKKVQKQKREEAKKVQEKKEKTLEEERTTYEGT